LKDEKHRLVHCNGKYHVILPSGWVKAVDIQEGDEITLEIDDDLYLNYISSI